GGHIPFSGFLEEHLAQLSPAQDAYRKV
ncbi:MAG: hypothetical protein RLZZ463_834, partial [Bacteroidota bacterium]